MAIVAKSAVAAVVNLGNRNRSAHREAVVVFVICGRTSAASPCRTIEESNGIEEAVAVNLKKIAVIAVRSRGHLVSQSALTKTELRREGGTLYAKLLHHLIRRVEVQSVAFGLGLRGGDAVVDNFLFKVDATANAMRKRVARDVYKRQVFGSSEPETVHSGLWLYLLSPPFAKLENPLLVLSIRRDKVQPARKPRPLVNRFSTSSCIPS